MTISTIILWALQWFLAGWFVLSTVAVLPFVLTGRLDARRVPGFGALPRPLLIIVGVAHIVVLFAGLLINMVVLLRGSQSPLRHPDN